MVLNTRRGEVKFTSRGKRANIITQRPGGAYGMRRSRNDQEHEVASVWARIRAVLDAPDFWQAAARLPGSAKALHRVPGRPTDHPDWLFLLIATVTAIVGSQRMAVTTLRDPFMWQWLKDVTDDNSYRVGLGLAPIGDKPLARHHLKHFQAKWTSAKYRWHVITAKRAALGVAKTAARQQDLLAPGRPIVFDHPDPGQWLRFDGTVIKPVTTSRPAKDSSVTGRVDSSADYHHVGGDTKTRVYGTKYVFASVRTDDYQGRLILDYEPAVGETKTGMGNEAAVTMAIIDRLHPELPGMHGVIVDSVLGGKDIISLAQRGLLTVNYPSALRNPNRRKGGRFAPGRIDKSAKVYVLRHTRPSGGECVHHIHVSGTIYYHVLFDAHGNEVQASIDVDNLLVRPNADGTVRHYHVLNVPCQYGEQTIHIPLFHDPRKLKAKNARQHVPQKSLALQVRNRGEQFRAFPVNTPMFQVLYGRRNDTESLHNQFKRYLPKMPAYGAAAQSLYILGLVIAYNSLSRAHLLKRNGRPNALDAT